MMKQILSIFLFFVPSMFWAQPLTAAELDTLESLLNRFWEYNVGEDEEEAVSRRYVAQPKEYGVRIYFTDKKGTSGTLAKPEQFLSKRALERRAKFGIAVDELDLPVSQKYLARVAKEVAPVKCTSKWLNTAVVLVSDTTCLERLRTMPFVKGYKVVYESPDSVPYYNPLDRAKNLANTNGDTEAKEVRYGNAFEQAQMLSVPALHEQGYDGTGVLIAIMDGGFHNVDKMKGFEHLRILDTKNFVRPSRSVYEEAGDHGTMVLSCIGGVRENFHVGTAPKADICLYVSEDGESEYEIEEDYWVAALEHADSIGADLTSTSLGYQGFDNKAMSHKYYELDGETCHASRAASLAASRGLVCVGSAGNSGEEQWHLVTVPGDARYMLTVGAVESNGMNTNFSSLGPTQDGRIKPDVMAIGYRSSVFDGKGRLTRANGTSFACPTMAGAVACLLQAVPSAKPVEVIHAVQQSGDNVKHPNNVFGYGIPSMTKALQLLKK